MLLCFPAAFPCSFLPLVSPKPQGPRGAHYQMNKPPRAPIGRWLIMEQLLEGF